MISRSESLMFRTALTKASALKGRRQSDANGPETLL